MGLFRKREPTKNEKAGKEIIQMVTTWGEHYYAWNGNLYESDIIRACIRPKVKSVGKLVGQHVHEDKKGIQVNPDANIRFLLSEPNPFMTGQQMQEKVCTQLCLNNNAFILVIRDENGIPVQLYPIPCVMCETEYRNDILYLKFQYKNGKSNTFPYDQIIHLRQDFNDNDIFGESPAPALNQLMEVVGTIDQGIIKAIKNSGIIRWLLMFNKAMRPEDVKQNVKDFVNNYLSIESDTFGAAGVDAKAEAKRIEPKDYVPNVMQMKETYTRIKDFFNTNDHIIQSQWTEDEWNAYFTAEIETVGIQMSQTYSIRLFTRNQRAKGDRIEFTASNMQCASMSTKLAFVSMVDRGAMTPNEWRAMMNLSQIPGGDKPLRRLDTEVVNMIEGILAKMTSENYIVMAGLITKLLDTAERREDETQNQHPRVNDTEQLQVVL